MIPTRLARFMNERILVPNTPFSFARERKESETGDGIHNLDAVLFTGQALVDLQKGTLRFTFHRYDTE